MQTNPEITNGLTFEVKSWVQHVVDVNVIWNVSNMQFKDSNGSTFEMPNLDVKNSIQPLGGTGKY
jgi:hypothetical protein